MPKGKNKLDEEVFDQGKQMPTDQEKERAYFRIGGYDWNDTQWYGLGENWFHVRKGGEPVQGQNEFWVHFVGAAVEIELSPPDFLPQKRGPGRPKAKVKRERATAS